MTTGTQRNCEERSKELAKREAHLAEMMALFDEGKPAPRRKLTVDDMRQLLAQRRQQRSLSASSGCSTGAANLPVTAILSIASSDSACVPPRSCPPDRHAVMKQLSQRNSEQKPTTQDSYKKTRLQKEMAEWLGEVEWNLMVTLTFKGCDGVSLSLATKLFGQFIPKLRAIVLRKGSRQRIRMAPFVEDSREQLQNAGLKVDGREGTHIHVLLQVRGDDLYKYKNEIEKAWKATNWRCGEPTIYCPNSSEWFLPLTSDEMRTGFTGYVLKHHGTDTLGLLLPYVHLD